MKVTRRFLDTITKEITPPYRRKLAYSLKQILDFADSGQSGELLTRRKVDRLHGNLDDTAKKLDLGPTYEWKPSIRQRVVFSKSNEVVFIDYSHKHQAVEGLEEQGKSQLRSLLSNIVEAPDWLINEINSAAEVEQELAEFTSKSGGNRETFLESLDNDWIKFLDRQQQEVLEKLEENLLKNSDVFEIHMILGGAGTGKTMVLLQLAWRLRNLHEFQVQLRLPSGVKEQIKYTLSEKDWWLEGTNGIFLLDDPISFDDIETVMKIAKSRSKPLVFAIDPTQWEDKKIREKFSSFLRKTEITQYELTTAYRQGGVIGEEVRNLASNFLRKSTFRADPAKIRMELESSEFWENLCLSEVQFADNTGHYKEYECTTPEDYSAALEEIYTIGSSYSTYRYNWPKFLIAADYAAPNEFRDEIKELQDSLSIQTRSRSLSDAKQVRGSEFENVVLAITKRDWRMLRNGANSLSTPDWEKLLRILTYMTRAENQLAIIIIS